MVKMVIKGQPKPLTKFERKMTKPTRRWFVEVKREGQTCWKRVPKGTPGAVLLYPKKGKLALSGKGRPVPIIEYAPKREKKH